MSTPDPELLGQLRSLLGEKGVREEPKLQSGHTWHRRERHFGEFSKTIQLDFRIQPNKVTADYNRGVLEILVPRALEDRSRTIKVTAG